MYSVQPQNTKFTMEQQYNNMMNQMQQNQNIQQPPQQQSLSDPHLDYIKLLEATSTNIKLKMNDDIELQQCNYDCESIKSQALDELLIPQILQHPQARAIFERRLQTAKKLKVLEEGKVAQLQQQMETLMNDEVVMKRLQELQNNQAVLNSQNQNNINTVEQIQPKSVQKSQQQQQSNKKNSTE